MRTCLISFTILFLLRVSSWAQSPVADFTIPASACLQQKVPLTNESTGSTNYVWDFCGGDLSQAPTASVLVNDFGSYGIRVEIIESNGEYFGFFTSGGTRALFRLSFGSDLSNTPVSTNLGGLGISSNQIRGIDIVSDGGLYYGFIVDSDKNKVYRIDFGNSLMNNPQDAVEIFSGAPLNTPYQITSVSDGPLKYLFVTNQGDGKLVRLKFDTSFGGPVTESFPLPISLYWLNAVSFQKADNIWHCATVSVLTGEVLKIDFLNGLNDNAPVTSSTTLPAPMSVELVNENGKYYAFVQTRNPTLSIFRLDFESALDSPPQNVTELPPLTYQGSELWNLSVYNSKSTWVGFSTESVGANIFRITFPNNCFSETKYSESPEPEIVSSNSGSFVVSLTAKDALGNSSYSSQPLIVSAQTSSDIDFASDNICANNDVNFVSENSSNDIAGYSWLFGDAGASTDQNPTHQYLSSGEYVVKLEVQSNNGCKNYADKAITIYDHPVAIFSSPTGLICTNNEFTFSNSTTDNFDGHLSYEWLVDNNSVSIERDLKYTFTSGGDKDIKLKASIPGCTDEIDQIIANIQAGPQVGFSQVGQCEGNTISFTNSSVGDIAGYSWDFGNGNTSSEKDPTQTYPVKGIYNVKLQTTGVNGCLSIISKPVPIYSKPQPGFSIELPPFSCSGTPSQFTNTTPNPTDSNIASWKWEFDDDTNVTSADKNPLHIFSKSGDYDVTLTATTNFNCSSNITSSITISQGPQIDFTNTPACANQGTRFSDASGNDIKSWLWTIGNSTYAFSNPTHVFGSPGNYNVQLTVTGNNDCITNLSKTINVPAIPILDFSFSNPCEGQGTTFQDTSPFASDPVASELWDFAGSATKNGSSVQYSFSSAGTYAVKMTSTQQSGCVYSISKDVIISPTPVAKFSESPEWGVPPLSVQFTNQSTGANTYQWRFNDKSGSTSTDTSPAFQFTDLGDYVVDLIATSSKGCSSTVSSKISVIIPSLDVELTDLNLIKDPTSGTYRIMVTIKNRSNFTLTSADVIVDISGNARIKETIATTILPDAEVSQLLSNQIVPGTLFTYLCAELDMPTDIDSFNDKICESVSEEGVIFSPYPNPSNGDFRFDWISYNAGEAHFAIMNSMGQVVFQQDVVVSGSGFNQAQFDLTSYQTGTYFFKFNSGSLSKTIPISILR